MNIGGQLILSSSLQTLLKDIKENKIKNWDDVHSFYQQNAGLYNAQKQQHAYASLMEISGLNRLDRQDFLSFLDEALNTKEWMTKNIYESRAKDYQNEFRKMIYDNEEEMVNVIGSLEDNVFINKQQKDLENFRALVEKIRKRFEPVSIKKPDQ